MKIRDVELFEPGVINLINSQKFVAIRISGGIDSAILCHIILKYFPHIELLPFTFFNKLRPSAINSVNNVMRQLSVLNPNNKLMTHRIAFFDTTLPYIRVNDSGGLKQSPKDALQRQYIRDLFDEYNGDLNLIFSGESLNPPANIQAELNMDGHFLKYRNEIISDVLLKYTYNNEYKYEYRPFINYTKKQISEVCKELGLMETLFPYTETCESVPRQYNDIYTHKYGITYTTPGVEPCQCCWPCREKFWAYGVFDFNTPVRVKDLIK